MIRIDASEPSDLSATRRVFANNRLQAESFEIDAMIGDKPITIEQQDLRACCVNHIAAGLELSIIVALIEGDLSLIGTGDRGGVDAAAQGCPKC